MRLIDADALEPDADYDDGEFWAYSIGQVDSAHTIEPEQRWIPCSERLPDEKDAGILKKLGIEKRSEDVLATVEVKGERMTVTACTYDGKWEWDMKYAFPGYKVIAWMPLPEPYRKEGEKHEGSD